jgi:hypothetical protein
MLAALSRRERARRASHSNSLRQRIHRPGGFTKVASPVRVADGFLLVGYRVLVGACTCVSHGAAWERKQALMYVPSQNHLQDYNLVRRSVESFTRSNLSNYANFEEAFRLRI